MITSEGLIPPTPIPIKYLSVMIRQTLADPEQCLSLPFMDTSFSGICFGINDFYFEVKPEVLLINSVPTGEGLNFFLQDVVSFEIYIDKGFSIVVDVHCRIRISGRDERSMNKDPETSINLHITKVSH